MKCFTFFHCQLQKGLQITQFIPPNEEKLRGPAKEVLFLGQYGKKYDRGPSNIARSINLDKDNPAVVEKVTESSRIICNPFNMNEPSYSQRTCRVVTNAYPRKVFRGRRDGGETYFIVLSKPYAISNNLLVRINTSSSEALTGRRGRWDRVTGKAAAASRSRSVKENNGFPTISWTDDLVVLHDQDVIRVVTESSDEIDDQILMNVNGHLVMAPAMSFLMSGIEPEPATAEMLERDMAMALAEHDFAPTESLETVTGVQA